jgi:hypothetical protein
MCGTRRGSREGGGRGDHVIRTIHMGNMGDNATLQT